MPRLLHALLAAALFALVARTARAEDPPPAPPAPVQVRAVDAPEGLDDPRALRRLLKLAPEETAVLLTGATGTVRAEFGETAQSERDAPYVVVGLPEGVYEVTLSYRGDVRTQRIKPVPGALVTLDVGAVFAEEEFVAPDRLAHQQELYRKLDAQIAAVPDVPNKLRLIEAFLHDHPEGHAADRARQRREELSKVEVGSQEDDELVKDRADLETVVRRQEAAAELRLRAPRGSTGRRIGGGVLLALAGVSFAGAVAFDGAANDAAWEWHAARAAGDDTLAYGWLDVAEKDEGARVATIAAGATLASAGVIVFIVDGARTADWMKRRKKAGIGGLDVLPGPGWLAVKGVLP